MSTILKWDLEYTDTLGGEANYCWVKRRTLSVAYDDSMGEGVAMRKYRDRRTKAQAKEAMGLKGVRGEWSEYGDTYEFRPRGMCTVLFVTFHDCHDHCGCRD